MQVTAWSNGRHHASGAGYGLKLRAADRDRHFQRVWSSVYLVLPGRSEPVEVNVAKASFWNASCRELISQDIGQWLITNGHAPWQKGRPPRFELTPAGERRFRLSTG